MTDFGPLLQKAIAALPDATQVARCSVYDRARAVLTELVGNDALGPAWRDQAAALERSIERCERGFRIAETDHREEVADQLERLSVLSDDLVAKPLAPPDQYVEGEISAAFRAFEQVRKAAAADSEAARVSREEALRREEARKEAKIAAEAARLDVEREMRFRRAQAAAPRHVVAPECPEPRTPPNFEAWLRLLGDE